VHGEVDGFGPVEMPGAVLKMSCVAIEKNRSKAPIDAETPRSQGARQQVIPRSGRILDEVATESDKKKHSRILELVLTQKTRVYTREHPNDMLMDLDEHTNTLLLLGDTQKERHNPLIRAWATDATNFKPWKRDPRKRVIEPYITINRSQANLLNSILNEQ